MQCTRLKTPKLHVHAQPVSGVALDTLWQTTMIGTLAVTVVLHVTSKSNKQF